MANRDVASIQSALATYFYETVTQNINRATVLGQILPRRPGTGQNIQWDAQFGTAAPTTAVITDGADVSVYNADTKVPAVLQYGTYHDAFAVTGKAMAVASAAGNPSQLANLVGDELKDSAQRLAKVISSELYVGPGTANRIHGLLDAAGPLSATGTYAGLARGTYAQWASNEIDGSALAYATLGFKKALRALRTACYVASGEKFDVFVCDPATHALIGEEYNTERRWVDQIRLARGTIKLEGGYNVLEFDGIPIIEDADCSADTICALNTNHVFLTNLQDNMNQFNSRVGFVPLMGTPEEHYGTGSPFLMAGLVRLAVTGDAHKFANYVWPQLVCRRPNAVGKITSASSVVIP